MILIVGNVMAKVTMSVLPVMGKNRLCVKSVMEEECLGIAISAIIPKIKITANNSINVNPFFILSPIINYIIQKEGIKSFYITFQFLLFAVS